jgi:hypothetical protein
MEDRQRAGQVGEEDDARLQRRDEERLEAVVVAGELLTELADACLDLRGGEVDLPDPLVGLYEASFRRYR